MSKGENTRAAIIDQATDLASVHGLEGLSIGKLASLTGMSKSGLFRHFGSKESLQQAVLAKIVEEFRTDVIVPALAESTGLGRLRAIYRSTIRWNGAPERLNGGCPIVAVTVELDDQPGALRDFLCDMQARWLNVIQRCANKAVTEGEFRPDLDTEQFAFEFHSVGLGLNYARRLWRDPKADERAESAFERLIASARTH